MTVQITDGDDVGPEKRVPYLDGSKRGSRTAGNVQERSGQVKLTAEEVGEIRYLHKHKEYFVLLILLLSTGSVRHYVSELATGRRMWQDVEIPKSLPWMA